MVPQKDELNNLNEEYDDESQDGSNMDEDEELEPIAL
jgi:hypothetical protein